MGMWDSYPLIDLALPARVVHREPQVGAQRLKETETVVDKLKADGLCSNVGMVKVENQD